MNTTIGHYMISNNTFTGHVTYVYHMYSEQGCIKALLRPYDVNERSTNPALDKMITVRCPIRFSFHLR